MQQHIIESIFFLDDQNAIALGGKDYEYGISQASEDGGASWTVDTIGEKIIKDFDIYQDSIYAAGWRGWYYNTDAALGLWKASRPDDRSNINGIVKQDKLHIVVGGASFSTGFIKRLDQNLNQISILEVPGELFDITKTTDQTLHAVGYGQIYRSQDNGATWIISEQEGDNYQHVFFISNKIGWLVGQAGSILKTQDAGISWTEQRKPRVHVKQNFNHIHFQNEEEGVVVGDDGEVRYTTDGGDSWIAVEGLPDYDYTSVHLRAGIAWIGSAQGHILKVEL